MSIELDEKTNLALVLIPDETGVNFGVTIPGHEDEHMWMITPDHLAMVLKGKPVELNHAVRPEKEKSRILLPN